MTTYSTQNPLGSSDPRDLYDNAENLDEAVNSSADTFQDRMGKSRLTWAGIVKAGTGDPAIAVDAAARAEAAASDVEQNAEQISQDAAQQAAASVIAGVDEAVDRAEAARDAAFVNADLYQSWAEGVAATVEGEQFQVVEGDEIVRYRRTPTGAVEVARILSADGSTGRISKVEGATSLAISNPNLFSSAQAAGLDREGMAPSGTVIPADVGGTPCWSNTNTRPWGPFQRADLLGSTLSAAVNILQIEAGFPGSNVRVLVQQSSSQSETTEIMSARTEVVISPDNFRPGFVHLPGIAIHPDCVTIRLSVGRSGDGVIYYRDMLLAEVEDATFRQSPTVPLAYKDEMDGRLLDLSVRPSLAVSNPNLFSAAQAAGLDTEGMSGNATQGEWQGEPCWELNTANTVNNTWGRFQRDMLSGTTLTASVQLLDMEGVTQGENWLRVVVQQYRSDATEISEARAEKTIHPDGFKPGFYSLKSVPIHTECDYVRLFIGMHAEGGVALYKNMLLAAGPKDIFRVSYGSAPSLSRSREVWVSPNGSDSGRGSSVSPFATLGRAAAELDGRGSIYLAAGDYGSQAIPKSAVKDLRIVGDIDAGYDRPTFKYGSLMALSAVPGRTGIFQGSLTSDYDWLWVDGIPDEQTLVPYAEQHAFLNGREHRLESTKIWGISAPDFATALDMIEASPTPVFWRDASSSIAYLNLPAGASGASTPVRVPATVGIFSGSTTLWTPEGHVELVGIDVRYGPVDLRSFRSSELSDVSVLGAGANGFLIANWTDMRMCRAGGNGSRAGFGDGFNAHDHAVWTFRDIYGHDNWDDGESTHENCRTTGYGSIMEYNGGGGFVPAAGAQEVLHNCLSRKNSVDPRISLSKHGGFMLTGTPIDGGVITTLEAYNCTSVGDLNGFYDNTGESVPSDRRLLAVNCKVFDAEQTAYACAEIIDCSESGSELAKSPATVVRNTSVVT